MNFGAGWVAVRREILEHLHKGWLSSLEFSVLMTLILLADAKTGTGTINAPTLRTFLPDLSYEAAKRVLKSLEDKKYIYRQITPMSKLVYPFWVNKYVPSTGPYKDRQLDLTEVFETKDIKRRRYVRPAPDSSPEAAPDYRLNTTPNYNKGQYTTKNDINYINTVIEENASSTAPQKAGPTSTATAPLRSTIEQGVCASLSDTTKANSLLAMKELLPRGGQKPVASANNPALTQGTNAEDSCPATPRQVTPKRPDKMEIEEWLNFIQRNISMYLLNGGPVVGYDPDVWRSHVNDLLDKGYSFSEIMDVADYAGMSKQWQLGMKTRGVPWLAEEFENLRRAMASERHATR